MSRAKRDTQRLKLYAAENAVALRHEKPYSTLLEVWVFLDRVRKDKWFIRHYGRWNFKVADGRRTRIARGGYQGRRWTTGERIGWLNLPRWSRNRLIILHEITHCLEHQQNNNTTASHGREYAALYLKLVRHFLGREAEQQLKAGFKEKGVKFRPKKQLSPETRMKLAERLRAVRAAAKTP